MKPFRALSVAEQLMEYLRQSISSGELSGEMPGARKLSSSLGVSSNTMDAAVEQLEREGFLKPQGKGRRSLIVLPDTYARPAFRVTLLLYEREDLQLSYVAEIQQQLKDAGHEVTLAERTLVDLGMKVERIARMAKKTETDAWVILSATQEVLEWFIANAKPAFAIAGRFRPLPMAGIGADKVDSFRVMIRRLVELGHRRIVLLQPDHMRKPTPGLLLDVALDEMQSHGIITGSYNLPDWEQTPEGLERCLQSLFALSPPTALILDQAREYVAAQHYLAQQGIFAPRDISLICTDDDAMFEWCKPSATCIQWGSGTWVRRILRWVENVSNGKDDRRKTFTTARFVERASIGPVPSVEPFPKRPS